MCNDSVIPENDRSFLPVGSKLEVRVYDEALVKKSKNSIALGLGNSNDSTGEAFEGKRQTVRVSARFEVERGQESSSLEREKKVGKGDVEAKEGWETHQG